MKEVKNTVMKMDCCEDLISEYENPIEHPCDMKPGQEYFYNEALDEDVNPELKMTCEEWGWGIEKIIKNANNK